MNLDNKYIIELLYNNRPVDEYYFKCNDFYCLKQVKDSYECSETIYDSDSFYECSDTICSNSDSDSFFDN